MLHAFDWHWAYHPHREKGQGPSGVIKWTIQIKLIPCPSSNPTYALFDLVRGMKETGMLHSKVSALIPKLHRPRNRKSLLRCRRAETAKQLNRYSFLKGMGPKTGQEIRLRLGAKQEQWKVPPTEGGISGYEIRVRISLSPLPFESTSLRSSPSNLYSKFALDSMLILRSKTTAQVGFLCNGFRRATVPEARFALASKDSAVIPLRFHQNKGYLV